MRSSRTIPGRRTDVKSAQRVCVPLTSARSTASTAMPGAGDGLQPSTHGPRLSSAPARVYGLPGCSAMSHRTIAAALALEGVSVGERLAVFSLASFANREHRAWPGARVATARAGLSRTQYLAACAQLSTRGLIDREHQGDGVAGATVMRLAFADTATAIEREVNPRLFEQVLSRSRARGAARVLLAVLAALASEHGVVEDVATDELRRSGGLADSTYRRARAQLLGSGEVWLEQAGGGRSRSNRWRVADLAGESAEPLRARADRPAPPWRQLPLMAACVASPEASASAVRPGRQGLVERPAGRAASGPENPGQSRTGHAGNPAINPAQNRTPAGAESPSQTPPETPPPNARAGREPKNQTTTPPDPPQGGPSASVAVVEHFVSDRGRRRQRTVGARAGELCALSAADRDDWLRFRELLCQSLGCSAFEIWLGDYEPIACSDLDQALLVAGCRETHQWVAVRYRDLFNALSARIGRTVRPANERELALHDALSSNRGPAASPDAGAGALNDDHEEAV